jgi:germination protein M
LIDWSLQDGVLNVEFSEGYGGLSGIDLTIADYCVTLTLCQLDEVRSVAISVDGDIVPSRYYETLHSSDVLLSATEDDPVSTAVTLYFPLTNGMGLRAEQRDVLTSGGATRSEAVVTAFMEGPKGDGLRSLMPKDTVLLSTSVESGVCYVDFSAAFGKAPIAETAEGALLLYSMVDTLCNLSGVNEVQLLIEGEAPVFFGGVPTLTPLQPDFSLVKND